MYRHCLKLPLESVRLHEEGEPGLWGWYLLPARTPVRLDMEGEVRLQVEQHVLLDGTEPSRIIPYQIDVSLDGTPCAPLNFATTPLSSRLMYAQGHPQVLGRREQGFISIPEGKHALEMVTSRDMFVRVRVHDGHEFLVPDLNLTHWLDEPASSCDPVALRSRALSLAWDNGRRNGGVLAAALMRRAADVRRDVPGLPAMARLSEAMFTFYRDLFPDSPSRSRETCFFTPQLPDPRGSHNLVVQEDSWPTLLETLDQGRFFRLPEDGTLIRFGLPDRPAATSLRMAVILPDTATSLEIDLGEREPVHFLVRPRGFLFADGEHSPGHTESPEASESPTTVVPAPDISQAGLLLVGQRFKGLDPTTLGGPFAAIRDNASLDRVGYVELDLPGSVREIGVRLPGTGNVPVWIALQYRASRTFSLDEFLYDFLLEKEKRAPLDLFLAGLERPDAIPERLSSHWQPLFRFLQTRETLFSSRIGEKWEPGCLRSVPGMDGIGSIDQVIDRAEAAQGAGDLITALSYWAAVLRLGGGEDRIRAIEEQDRCLRGLGENYLAGMILRSVYVHGERAERQIALERMRSFARTGRDEDELLTLAVVEFMDQQTPKNLARISSLLLARGSDTLGLMAGLLVPESKRPMPELLLAARKQGWNRTAEDMASRMPAEERFLWQGLDQATNGIFDQAYMLWKQGGEQGRDFSRSLSEARDIASRLYGSKESERKTAVRDWETWSLRRPGPWTWKEQTASVLAPTGMVRTRSLTADVRRVWHLVDRENPLAVNVWGPSRLRLVIRPLHAPGSEARIDGWVTLTTPHGSRHVPVTGNTPSQGLELENDVRLPGRAVTRELEMAGGPGEIHLETSDFSCLVRVERWQPVCTLPVLPELTPETVGVALQGMDAWQDDPGTRPWPWPWQQRLTVIDNASGRKTVFTQDRVWKIVAGQDAREGESLSLPTVCSRSEDFDTQVQDTRQDLIDRAHDLAFRAEQHPGELPGIEAELRHLAHDHPQISEIRTMRDRVGRVMVWERLQPASSGGSYAFPLAGWEPETPVLRVRKGLLPCLFPGEHVLSQPGKLIMDMYNVQPASLVIETFLGDFPWLGEAPLNFWYDVDGKDRVFRTLSRRDPDARIEIDVPAGEHVVRVGVDTLYVNQFLRVMIHEPGQGCSSFACTDPGWSEYQERAYTIAAHGFPAIYQIEGPAWVRVDRKEETSTSVRYRYFSKGMHDLVLNPEQGRMESYYRVFARVPFRGEEPVEGMPRDVSITYAHVPDSQYVLSDPPTPEKVVLADADDLSEFPWKGTWEMEAGYHARRDVQEDGTGDAEQFWQLGVVHRRYFETLPAYLKTGLTPLRVRKHGGIVSGVEEEFVYSPDFLPFTLGLRGSFLAQDPDGDARDLPGTGEGDTEWSGLVRASISRRLSVCPEWWHTPGLRVFGRLLSMDELGDYASRDVDQDIFTPYKHDHRQGISVSDTLTWAPWADTRIAAGASATSNEDGNVFAPDNIRARLSWEQLLGPFLTKVGLRHARYFEDDDRDADSHKTFVDMECAWTRWTEDKDRLRIGLSGTVNTDTGDWSSAVVLGWVFDGSRELRDFRSGETVFPVITTWAVPGRSPTPVLEPEPAVCPELRTRPAVMESPEDAGSTPRKGGRS
jgi:hypothetical protein